LVAEPGRLPRIIAAGIALAIPAAQADETRVGVGVGPVGAGVSRTSAPPSSGKSAKKSRTAKSSSKSTIATDGRPEHDPESGHRFSLATNAKRLRGDHAQTIDPSAKSPAKTRGAFFVPAAMARGAAS